jgi:DeoR/GlpR family transcriptional regulator of sugar metabolism
VKGRPEQSLLPEPLQKWKSRPPAAETIVLASAEKLNAASPYVIAPLSQVSGIIVEAETPEEIVADFRRLGITVTRAS